MNACGRINGRRLSEFAELERDDGASPVIPFKFQMTYR
jgi:hypothetical protein